MTDRPAAIVPVLDEEAAIGPLVSGLLARGACCVIVVDSGSQDRTVDTAHAAGARVVNEPRRGYGMACLTGAIAAQQGHRHARLAFLDGDGSCDPADLPALLEALDGADLVLGRRDVAGREPGALAWHAQRGNHLVAALLRLRTGRIVRDLPPFKAIRAELLKRLALSESGYAWTVQLIARALNTPDARIIERPVRFRRRRGGVSKVSGSLRASLRAGAAMLTGAWRETCPRPVIALVAKAPRRGHVKTRLAAEIGDGRAVGLWEACLADAGASLLASAQRLRARPLVVVPCADEAREVLPYIGREWETIVQTSPGLGGAIADAFRVAAARGGDRAIVVSGDNPDLPDGQVEAALAALDRSNAVLGPTLDGGYHLIGLRWRRLPAGGSRRESDRRRFEARILTAFGSLQLGGGDAAVATRRALRAAGWRSVEIASWPDVDTLDDLHDVARRLEAANDEVAPATRAWLATHASLLLPSSTKAR